MSDLNDALGALFEGDKVSSENARPIRDIPVYKTAVERFVEGCPKCKGRGRFISWSGRDVGPCFACKGEGKRSFKTSSETRANNRDKSAMKKAQTISVWREDCKAELAWLETATAKQLAGRQINWDFPVKLSESLAQFGTLTDGQIEGIRKCMARDVAWAAERAAKAANAPAVDVSAIEQAFATAREKAARPGQMGVMVKPLKLAAGPSKEDIAFKCSPGSIGSRWEGQIFFKSMDDRKLGYVKDGKFIRQFACTDAEAQAVVTVASNPREGLFAFAKAWSRCGVCGKQLLNEVSIERGIGPICLERYGFA